MAHILSLYHRYRPEADIDYHTNTIFLLIYFPIIICTPQQLIRCVWQAECFRAEG